MAEPKSWTFKDAGSRTRLKLDIIIADNEWTIRVTVMDPVGRVVDVYTFTLDSLWVTIFKMTMRGHG